MTRHKFLLATLFLCTLFGCKESKKSDAYEPQYSEQQLVGEWIGDYKSGEVPKTDITDRSKYYMTIDTLSFYNNNTVVKRKSTGYKYEYLDDVWGTYEVLNGTYHMTNDTLIMTFDYPHIYRQEFGRDPFGSLNGSLNTIYVDPLDSVSEYYGVEMDKKKLILSLFMEYDYHYSSNRNFNNVKYQYYRR